MAQAVNPERTMSSSYSAFVCVMWVEYPEVSLRITSLRGAGHKTFNFIT